MSVVSCKYAPRRSQVLNLLAPGQLTLRPPALWLSHFALCPIVDHARVTVMTFSSPPLQHSRPGWRAVSMLQTLCGVNVVNIIWGRGGLREARWSSPCR